MAVELFDHDVAYAEATIRRTGELKPMFVVHGREATTIIGATWTDEPEKVAVMAWVKIYAIAHDAIALATFHEIWMTNPATRQRREAVLVVHAWRTDEDEIEQRHSIRPIRRDAAGTIVELDPALPPNPLVGRMFDLLVPARPTAALRERARELLAEQPMPLVHVHDTVTTTTRH